MISQEAVTTKDQRTSREDRPRIAGLRTFIRDVGEGPPVLLINGLGAHTDMWVHLEQRLVGNRVVSFDAPGTGKSQTPLAPLTIPGLAWFAGKVLDHVGLDRADVLGYSMGGIVAQQLAIQSPHRVRRLVLVATSVGLGVIPGTLTTVLNLATPLRFHVPWVYRRTFAGLAGGRARHDPDWVRQHLHVRMEGAPSTMGYLNQLAAMVWTTLPWLAHVQHPALVVVGDDDPLIPLANGMLLTHRLPHARGFLAAGEGHMMLMDADSAVFGPIREFLAVEQHTDADAWRSGFCADDHQLQQAIEATFRQAQPWGAVSAIVRRLTPTSP